MATKKEESAEVVEAVKIETIAHDFLREDMNELRDKLNLIIERVNNLD